MNNFEKMSDKELYAQCKKWGLQALEAKHKFEGLLPEVNRRRLYERRGFETIYDFARIIGGLSRDQVNRVFSVCRKLEDKPVLQKMLIEGQVSVNKLCRVTAIATRENQAQIAEVVTKLSQKALEIKVREIKQQTAHPQADMFENENSCTKPCKDVRAHSPNLNKDIKLMRILSEEMKDKLLEIAEKGHDLNQILLELLEKRESAINQKIQELSQKQAVKEAESTPTRPIPTAIQKTINEIFGTKCSAPNCHKPAEHIHHERPFAKYKSHDPQILKPLCKGHHELWHAERRFGDGWRNRTVGG